MEYSKTWPSYYSVLGVGTDSSDDEIRRAYRKLAMQWHPDKWSRSPSFLGEAKQKFQQIQEAYSVLSDRRKRTLYDAGMYDPDDDDDDDVEGFADFVQEMVVLMEDARKEEKNYSIEELQSMFWEMAQGFEIPEWSSMKSPQQPMYNESQWFCGSFSLYEPTVEASMMQGNRNPHFSQSSFDNHFCR
ncbi:hypothetical protein BUALT_Bualt05G0113000 [Buddleja alternifolia]|uniref:J domain-containing protein n=1 Tax=Buddleja alternifolia TaxID=168488 RepID=A0AAV6XIC5_9LAMI|nr:hypothetical protein BUALT_Bualt05G0113000 [Buddleja alternifolia]